MTRLPVILGAFALVLTASSALAGLKEAPPEVRTDGDSRCGISEDGNTASGSCCVGNDDGSISCVVETVTSIPSADYKIPPGRKFPAYVFGTKPFAPPWPSYVNPHAFPARWPLVPLPHVQKQYSFGSSVVAHPPQPVHRFASSVINHVAFNSHAAFVSRAAVVSHPAVAGHAAFGRSFGRGR